MASRAEYATRPRARIAAVLHSAHRFFTAAEVHRALGSEGSSVSLSTVYRTLEHLREKGEAEVRHDEGGESSYMACEPVEHHHHAICNACGKVEDVDCTAIEQIVASLRSAHGFELDEHSMEFFGRCASCR